MINQRLNTIENRPQDNVASDQRATDAEACAGDAQFDVAYQVDVKQLAAYRMARTNSGQEFSPDFIVVIGGIDTIQGPIIGALIFFALRELLSDYGSWYLMVMGLVAIVVMIKWPKGIFGSVQQHFSWRLFPVQRRLRERAAA